MKSILKVSYCAILILLISCENSTSNNTQEENIEQQQQQELQTKQHAKIKIPDTLSYTTKNFDRIFPECEGDDCTTYSLEYIEISNKEYHFINDSIRVELMGSYTSMDDAADDFFDEYEEVTLDIGNEGFNPPWAHELNVSVDFNKEGLFTVSYGYYGYFGGAHGMPGFSSVNYDLATKQELTFYDLVNVADSTDLQFVGEKYFRLDNNLDLETDLAEAGYFWENTGFYFSDIFTLSDDGLIFTYSPYEIGPYAIGMPSVTIPYAELAPYLTENSPLKRLIK